MNASTERLNWKKKKREKEKKSVEVLKKILSNCPTDEL